MTRKRRQKRNLDLGLTAGKNRPTLSVEAETSVTALVERAALGDRDAFDRLAERFWGEIFRMVYYRTFSRADAEDLTQDIFLRAYSKLNSLRSFDRFRPWLFSISLNAIRDFQRRKSVLPILKMTASIEEHPLPDIQPQDEAAPLNGLMRQEFWGQVMMFTRSLPRTEREVFILRFFDQLTIREIATAMDKHESTIKTHLYRAVGKFQKSPRLKGLLREE